MGRYLEFDSNHFDFVTRADFSVRTEYFEEFIWGTTRDKSVYGVTRKTPEVTVEYSLNGLKFFKYVLGELSGAEAPYTITPADTLPTADYKASIDTYVFSVTSAKVESLELTVEEGSPVRVEFTARGTNYSTTTGANSYSSDLSVLPLQIHDVTVNCGGTLTYGRFSLRIVNNLDPEYKTSTLPVRYIERGLEVDGRIRLQTWTIPTEGGMTITLGNVGQIILPKIIWTEIPPRARGWDYPELELSFRAFATDTDPKIKVIANNDKW